MTLYKLNYRRLIMSYSYNPMSVQQEHNEMVQDEKITQMLEELSNNKEELTKTQNSPLTQTEQLPSTTTPTEEQQNQSRPQVNLEVLENLMSTLPPEQSQILAMVIPQLRSGSNLLDLASMMNSLTDEEITDSQLESLEDLFE